MLIFSLVNSATQLQRIARPPARRIPWAEPPNHWYLASKLSRIIAYQILFFDQAEHDRTANKSKKVAC